jgi:hypothetical protein
MLRTTEKCLIVGHKRSNEITDMEDHELKQSDQLYDYIKFHIGLYLATPAGVALVGQALNIQCRLPYQFGLAVMILAYLIAGAFASAFVANYLFKRWESLERWRKLGREGDTLSRKFLHHYLCWFGLLFAVLGGACSVFWYKVPACS